MYPVQWTYKYLIGSFSYLQVMRTCIKIWMSLNFRQIPPVTTELTALERLKIDITTSSRLLLIQSFSNLQVIRRCIISYMNFRQIGPPSIELAALGRQKISHRLIMGKTMSSHFIGSYLQVTMTYIRARMSSKLGQNRP